MYDQWVNVQRSLGEAGAIWSFELGDGNGLKEGRRTLLMKDSHVKRQQEVQRGHQTSNTF